jgi:hypothetical protein
MNAKGTKKSLRGYEARIAADTMQIDESIMRVIEFFKTCSLKAQNLK